MIGLSKPYRQALAASLLAVLVFMTVSFVIAPWLDGGLTHIATIDRLTAELQNRQDIADRLPSLEARLSALRQDPQRGKRMLSGANMGAAATTLQGSLRTIVNEAQGEIVSIQGLPAGPQKPLARVMARIVFRGSEVTLRDVLQGVSNAVPFLYVERLAVTSTGGNVTDLKAAAHHLTVTLEVFGYWRPRA